MGDRLGANDLGLFRCISDLVTHGAKAPCQAIDANVKQAPSAQCWILISAGVRLRRDVNVQSKVTEGTIDRSDLAFLVNQTLYCLHQRVKTSPHGFHDEDALLLCSSKDLFGLFGCQSECFFAQNVLSSLDGVKHVSLVEGVWRANIHAIDFRVVVDLLI